MSFAWTRKAQLKNIGESRYLARRTFLFRVLCVRAFLFSEVNDGKATDSRIRLLGDGSRF
jgi:hypothetical protein